MYLAIKILLCINLGLICEDGTANEAVLVNPLMEPYDLKNNVFTSIQ